MNTSTLRTFAKLSLAAALGSISLLAQVPVRATIPFDFTVGSKTFAAGEYSVRPAAPMVLLIQSADGHASMLVATNPGEGTKIPGNTEFTFNKYDDRYFLSKVSADSDGWALPKSAIEKELIAKRAAPQPLAVVASRPNSKK